MECQKPLTFLHKEKNNLSVSKGCYEERCWSSNKNLSNFFFQLAKLKLTPKRRITRRGPQTFWKGNPTKLTCVDVTHNNNNNNTDQDGKWLLKSLTKPWLFMCRPLTASRLAPCKDSALTKWTVFALT